MNLHPNDALKVIESLLVRAPVNTAEVIGVNVALESVRAALAELESLKAPKKE